MAAYRLHYFPESGNSYKLALMLTLCGQTFEPVWTDFGGGVTRTAEWRRTVNEMGEIPVLERDGARLTQTAPILLSLAERYGRFGGTDDRERFEILRWLFWDNHKLTSYMATYRFNRAFTPSPDANVLAFLRKRLDDFLTIADGHLRDKRFVVGERPTIADLSMVGYLFFPKEESGYDFATSYPAVHAWLGRVAALPGWRAPYDLLPGERLRRYTRAT
jgi:glutathione S-transferase